MCPFCFPNYHVRAPLDESLSLPDQLPVRPEHASIIRDFYSNQNGFNPPTSTQPIPRSYKWTVVSGKVGPTSPTIPNVSTTTTTTETILVTSSAYSKTHNDAPDTINHTLARNQTTLETSAAAAAADSNQHADVLQHQKPHWQLQSTIIRNASRAAIKTALSPTSGQLSTLATTNSSMMPPKTHKTDAPMLNYIFDSHLATNKHHHHDR